MAWCVIYMVVIKMNQLKVKINQKVKIVKDISRLTHMPETEIYDILALYSTFFTDIYVLTMLIKYGDMAEDKLNEEVKSLQIKKFYEF